VFRISETVRLGKEYSCYISLVNVAKIESGSRRLLAYRRLPGVETGPVIASAKEYVQGTTADELNNFRAQVSCPCKFLELD
jgi:hypothetical protein